VIAAPATNDTDACATLVAQSPFRALAPSPLIAAFGAGPSSCFDRLDTFVRPGAPRMRQGPCVPHFAGSGIEVLKRLVDKVEP